MRRLIVVVAVALLSLGPQHLAAASSSSCFSVQCIVNCVETIAQNPTGFRCRL